MTDRKLALVTGASTGIGLELARCAAEDGCDLIIVANEPEIESAAAELRGHGGSVDTVQADLGSHDGLDKLWAAVRDRHIDYLLANAGRGAGGAFAEQDWQPIKDVIDVNVTGTVSLLHKVLPQMIARGEGRVLVTGSIAGHIPGSFHAIYNASKAFLDNLSWALREETKGSGVTVTCLMPGLTETEFFRRAGLEDTPLGQSDDKDDPADVARQGWKAMIEGSSGVTTGFMNKVQDALSGIVPEEVLAKMHRKKADPDETD
jgi:short-subunit dehydrogenase